MLKTSFPSLHEAQCKASGHGTVDYNRRHLATQYGALVSNIASLRVDRAKALRKMQTERAARVDGIIQRQLGIAAQILRAMELRKQEKR